MVKLHVKFQFKKETPGTLCFEQIDDRGNIKTVSDGAEVPTIYIRKSALGNVKPQHLDVLITADLKG